MKIFSASVFLCFLFLGMGKAVTANASPTPREMADQAYNDLIGRFWSGSPTNGYIATLSHKQFDPVSPGAAFYPQTKAFAWWYAIGTTAIYSYWKETNSADALARLKTEWAWVKSFYVLLDFSTCGKIHNAPANFAQDDTAWNAFWLLSFYDATRDNQALIWAKAALDCGWAEWFDVSALDGGLWYSDEHKSKSSYQAQFILDQLLYYQFSNDQSYLEKAILLDKWMASNQRMGQTFYGNVFPNDGLYWADIAPNGTPFGNNRPNDIIEANSVTFLEGNMAMAVVDNRLSQITGKAEYQDRMNATANGILAHLINSQGAFLDDRDAMTNATAADLFAREVVPRLTNSIKSKIAAVYKTTAKLVILNDRSSDGTYGGSWSGPNNGTDIWSTKTGSLGTQLNVSATAIMWPISALAVQPKSNIIKK